MNVSSTGCTIRTVALGAVLISAAALLGGCFLFPKRTSVVSGAFGTGQIEGQVVDGQGQPIAGASATIPEAAQFTAVSDENGRFTFPGLASGVYYVQVQKEGYLAGSYVAVLGVSGKATVQARLLNTSGHLHNDSSRVANLCADCHVLHNPTSGSHLTIGSTPNDPCFKAGCHSPLGTNGGFDRSVYESSPHGRNWSLSSSTKPAWTGQAAIDQGNCATCHEPHGITGPPFMLRKGSQDADGTLHLNELCFECHSSPGSGHTAGWPGKEAYLDSGNLHVNPSSVPATTHRSYPGTRYAMGDCLNCHVPHGQSIYGDNQPHMLREQGYKLCLKCHTDKTDTNGSGHNGNCILCHDPHRITKTGGSLYVKDPANGTSMIPASKTGYRNHTLITSAPPGSGTDNYCLKCHQASPPSWVRPQPENPFSAQTGFWNRTSYSPYGGVVNNQNLHVVHVKNVIAFGGADYHGLGWSDRNKVWCSLCHTLHSGGSSISHNLSTEYFSSITGSYSGTWRAKSGCQVRGGCHDCAWCHASPGSPGQSCYCYGEHSSTSHSGVDY